jgi:DNA-binding protein H-NS
MADVRLAIRRLQGEVEAAEEDHEAALNVVDQRDDDATAQERALVEVTAVTVQKLQNQLEEQNITLQRLLESYEAERKRQLMCVRYRPEAAAEVFRLFPTVRYESMISIARDETELRDIFDFLSLLLKGSEASKVSGHREKRLKPMAQAAEIEKKAVQAAVSDSLFGEDNDFDEDSEAVQPVDSQISGDDGESQDDENYAPKKKLVDGLGLLNDNIREEGTDEGVGELPVQTSTASRHKILSGKDDYAKYKQITRLREFVERIAVPAADFGDGLRNGYKSEPPATPAERPDDLASQYIDGVRLSSSKTVLHAATQIIAAEISYEPSVRQFCRQLYRLRASISTRPTPAGVLAINPFHELFGLHYLDEKPINELFEGSRSERCMFLRLVEAEKNGLITVAINAPLKWSEASGRGSRVLDITPFLTLYSQFVPSSGINDEMDPVCRESWDKLRQQIIQKALDKYILPSLQEELKRDLIKSSKEAVFEQTRDKFASILAAGPYIPAKLSDNSVEFTKKMLKSCPNRPYSFSVAAIFQEANNAQANISMSYVDRDGILRQHTVLPGKAGMEKLKEKLVVFLFDNRPDAIMLNASGGKTSRSTKMLLEKNIFPEVAAMISRAKSEGRMNYYDDEDEDDDYSGPYAPHVSLYPAFLFIRSTAYEYHM